MRQPTFTPKELAKAVAASESSIKRWIDQGLLRASKTAGGHRRVGLADAFRFIRETGQTLVDPSALGLAAPEAVDFSDPESVRREYLKALEAGDERLTTSLVSHLHLLDVRIADILDDPMYWAFRDVRGRCNHPSAECVVLHRSFANTLRAAGRLRELEEPPTGRRRDESRESRVERDVSSDSLVSPLSSLDSPKALLADVGYDIDGLPTYLAETVLSSLGVRCTQMGGSVPDEVLFGAIERVKPTFLWISAGGAHRIDKSVVRKSVNEAVRLAERYHARVLLMGDAVPKRQELAGGTAGFEPTYIGSLAELSAFAVGVLGGVASPA